MRVLALGSLFIASATLAAGLAPPPPAKGPPSAAEAKRFIDHVDADLKTLMVKAGTADWIKNTYITDDTERMSATTNEELLDYTTAWSVPAREMRPLYARYVALANEGARDIGFPDTGAMWRSSYDMSPEAFERDAARLWDEVKPLYEELHCYVRAQLART